MNSLHTTLGNLGGIARVATLRRDGITESAIRTAVTQGSVRRVRKGWLCSADAAPTLVRAVKLGGRLACISAAAHRGLWTPDTGQLHVAVPRHSGRRHGEPAGTIIHWQGAAWATSPALIEPVSAIVRQVLLCCEREDAVAIIDSALHRGELDMRELHEIVTTLPPRFASVLTEVDRRSESGLESLCRWRLARHGLRIRSQVRIEGVGRVDLLIGDRLVLEADGREWHEGAEAFHADRTRDLALHRMGYTVLRVSYTHVMHEWMLVELAVLAMVARGQHSWEH